MEQKTYVEAAGLVCPACGARDVEEAGSWDWNDRYAFRPCRCEACGATWVDRFRLEGFDSLERES